LAATALRGAVDLERRLPLNYDASRGYGATVDPGDRGPNVRLLELEVGAESQLEVPSAAELIDSAVALVATAIPSCKFVAVVAPAGGQLTAITGSDPRAFQFERMQTQLGEGPSLHAATSGVVTSADDLSRETRWPAFVPRALAAGVRSVLSIPAEPERGAALTLYAGEPWAFGPDAPARAERFVSHIRLLLGALQSHAQDTVLIEQLRTGLESRTVIGQAQGILMERERITAEAAFAILRTTSQHANVKLREIAMRVVATGEDPRTVHAES
jgi:hypothetical protein